MSALPVEHPAPYLGIQTMRHARSHLVCDKPASFIGFPSSPPQSGHHGGTIVGRGPSLYYLSPTGQNHPPTTGATRGFPSATNGAAISSQVHQGRRRRRHGAGGAVNRWPACRWLRTPMQARRIRARPTPSKWSVLHVRQTIMLDGPKLARLSARNGPFSTHGPPSCSMNQKGDRTF